MQIDAIAPVSTRPSSAREIQLQLRAIEQAHNDAIADAGEMLGRVILTAKEGGVQPRRIERTLNLIYSSIGHALAARADIYQAHVDCTLIARKLNMDELGWGDVGGGTIRPSEEEIAADASVPATV